MSGKLNVLMDEIRALMDEKGFSADESRVWEMLALIHTEISEAAEAYRRGENFSQVGEELIDSIVRTLHLLSILGQDPDAIYAKVMQHNRSRPPKWNTRRGG